MNCLLDEETEYIHNYTTFITIQLFSIIDFPLLVMINCVIYDIKMHGCVLTIIKFQSGESELLDGLT